MVVNHEQETETISNDRQVVYTRYIDWCLTTPLLLLDLILMTKMKSTMITWVLFSDIAMIVLGIIGAFSESPYKWVYYAFSCLMLFVLTWGMLNPIFREELQINQTCTAAYIYLLSYLLGVWFFYPIVWGLGTGGQVISVDLEIILMGVLDVLAKPMFAVLCIGVQELVILDFIVGEVAAASEPLNP
eukprot:TRINITY_DN5070_c0_g1_i1.p2 TRINITY_DN5070_c0_g1~~TRINITY_DN5070_c0_g1_i1.p2  ORF type:complete len:187 (-),score=27.86 TRINITY_DN5070_c0_g1_i1:94-654(-)